MALMSLDREYRSRCFSSGKVGSELTGAGRAVMVAWDTNAMQMLPLPVHKHSHPSCVLSWCLLPVLVGITDRCPPAPPHQLLADDQPSSVDVLNKWMKKYGMQKKPKYIFGISSGASFAIKFPGAFKLDGVISGELECRAGLSAHLSFGSWRCTAGAP